MYETPPPGVIRDLLRSAFTPQDLHRFCRDELRFEPEFQKLMYRFGPNDNIEDMIDEIIDYCNTGLLWTEFLDTVAQHQSRWYNRFASRLGRKPVSPPPSQQSPPPATPIPAPKRDFDDVEIHITEALGGQYPVHIQTGELVGDTSGSMTAGWTDRELAQWLAYLEEGITDRDNLTKIGGRLFQALFTDSVRDRYMSAVEKSQAGLRLRLEAPGLQALPWELLYDADLDEFLALSGRVFITRYMTVRRGAPPLKVKPPLSILIVSAEPNNQPRLNTEAEVNAIQTALAPLEREGLVRVEPLPHARRFPLRDALRDHDPHVLHFVGHGNVGPQGGVLLLETAEGRADPLTGSTLASLLKRTKVRLAVINACLSARGAPLEAQQFNNQRRAVLGVGPALVQAGLGAVVANQFSAAEQQAKLFAKDFYDSLARFDPVDEAVSRAREALMLGSGEDSRSWATPVLFLRSKDGIIFEQS